MSLYRDYFHFSRDPFGVTPDPDLLLLTGEHRKAMGGIAYGIRDRRGFIAVTGVVGIGKTSVLRSCLDALDPATHRVIYIFNPHLSAAQLYAAILGALGDATEAAYDLALEQIQFALLRAYTSGINVVLAIDEAQHLSPETLEALRLISNLETGDTKLLQIILVGQTELDAVLARHELRQIEQRIAVRVGMRGLSFSQSLAYIQFRIEATGRRVGDIFTYPALLYIALCGGGIPRKLNIYGDTALVNCLGHGAQRVTLPIARAGIRDFLHRHKRTDPSIIRSWSLMVIALLAIGLAGIATFRGPVMQLVTPVQEEAAQLPQPVAAPPPQAQKIQVMAVAQVAKDPQIQRRQKPMSLSAPPRPHPSVPVIAAQPYVPVFVRLAHDGDTFYHLCHETYGACPKHVLAEVLAVNGTGDPRRLIEGEKIMFPYRKSYFLAAPTYPKLRLRMTTDSGE